MGKGVIRRMLGYILALLMVLACGGFCYLLTSYLFLVLAALVGPERYMMLIYLLTGAGAVAGAFWARAVLRDE